MAIAAFTWIAGPLSGFFPRGFLGMYFRIAPGWNTSASVEPP